MEDAPATTSQQPNAQPDAQDERPKYPLRMHIRQLLLKYASIHYTADRAQLTENAFANLSQNHLHPTLETDPSFYNPPNEPFKVLRKIFKLDSLPPFESKSQSTPTSVQLLKKFFKVRAVGRKLSRSERVTYEDPEYETPPSPIFASFTPMSTKRAMRAMPRFGSSKLNNPYKMATLPDIWTEAIKPVNVKTLPEPRLNQNEIICAPGAAKSLCSRVGISDMQSRLRPYERGPLNRLLQSVFTCLLKSDSHLYLGFLSRPGFPPHEMERARPAFIPTLSQKEQPEKGNDTLLPASTQELPCSIQKPVKIGQDEPELHAHHMKVVDGWLTFHSSPTTSPSPASTQAEVDELEPLSPETTPPPTMPSQTRELQILPPSQRRVRVESELLGTEDSHSLGAVSPPIVARSEVWESKALLENLGTNIGPAYEKNEGHAKDLLSLSKLGPDPAKQFPEDVPDLPLPNVTVPDEASIKPTSLNDFLAPLKGKGPTVTTCLSKLRKTFIANPKQSGCATQFADDNEISDLIPNVAELTAETQRRDAVDGESWIRKYQTSDGKIPGILSVAPFETPWSRKERRTTAELEDMNMPAQQNAEVAESTRYPADEYFEDSGSSRHLLQAGRQAYDLEGQSTASFPNDEELTSGDSALHIPSDEIYAGTFRPHPGALLSDSVVREGTASEPEIASRALGITEFARLRSKKISAAPAPAPASISKPTPHQSTSHTPVNVTPDSVYDRNTLRLSSDSWEPPSTLHHYMVSMELVQKQGLISCMQSQICHIEFVERESLGGVDVILDTQSAVLFTNLLVLPSTGGDLGHLISRQSWRYRHILVVFEAYPAAYSTHSKSAQSTSELFAYTDPVLKALQKLRRWLSIAGSTGQRCPSSSIVFAFADTVEQSAMFTRHFGNLAEARDESGGMLWGDRVWLDDESPEGESDLASAEGMNHFAAYVILCQMDLQQFLDLSPEDRLQKLSWSIGKDRMVRLNEIIQQRRQAMLPSSDTSILDE
ncbi:unnamed protein product [Mycena citricolor]|uniref:Uncharacterized protein n=1 Tax=Mycena citricolor TaxID=2018698 RepID=A0AAD2HNZ2_9AGAR|nr:unnamed protein product [Mycena citricolor]